MANVRSAYSIWAALVGAALAAACSVGPPSDTPNGIVATLDLRRIAETAVPTASQAPETGAPLMSANSLQGEQRVFHTNLSEHLALPPGGGDLLLARLDSALRRALEDRGARVTGEGSADDLRNLKYEKGKLKGVIDVFAVAEAGTDQRRVLIAATEWQPAEPDLVVTRQ